MIAFIKRDFRRVHEALNLWTGKQVPMGLFVLYYILMLPVALLLTPYAIYVVIKQNQAMKKIFKDWEA